MRLLSKQMVLALVLSTLYLSVCLSLAGFPLTSAGFPWWFVGTCIVIACAGVLDILARALLPVPWARKAPAREVPRHVHLSWRAAVRLPGWIPVLMLPWNVLSFFRMHLPFGWALNLLPVLAALVLVLRAKRYSRDIRLLARGTTAMAFVQRRTVDDDDNQIAYVFTVAGEAVSGTAWDFGYRVKAGMTVPVFYEPDNPQDHVVACGCRFEAD